jgi:hypothetical protein
VFTTQPCQRYLYVVRHYDDGTNQNGVATDPKNILINTLNAVKDKARENEDSLTKV